MTFDCSLFLAATAAQEAHPSLCPCVRVSVLKLFLAVIITGSGSDGGGGGGGDGVVVVGGGDGG